MNASVKDLVRKKIKKSRSKVFMRSDFKKLGSYTQIGRALNSLIDEALLVKMGHGIYVKAQISGLSGKPIPTMISMVVALQVMKKLHVKVDVGHFWRLQRDGLSTQCPMRESLAVNKKITRKIGWNGRMVQWEYEKDMPWIKK